MSQYRIIKRGDKYRVQKKIGFYWWMGTKELIIETGSHWQQFYWSGEYRGTELNTLEDAKVLLRKKLVEEIDVLLTKKLIDEVEEEF